MTTTREAALEAALIEIAALDDSPQCCGNGVGGGYGPPECCGSPTYGIDRAQAIATAALAARPAQQPAAVKPETRAAEARRILASLDQPALHDELATMISDLSHTGELSMLYRMEIADRITTLRTALDAAEGRVTAAYNLGWEAGAWVAMSTSEGDYDTPLPDNLKLEAIALTAPSDKIAEAARVLDDLLQMRGEYYKAMSHGSAQALWDAVAGESGFAAVTAFLRALAGQGETP